MLQSDQSYYLVPYINSQDCLNIEIVSDDEATAEKFEELREAAWCESLGNPDFNHVIEVHPVHGVLHHEFHEILAKFGKVSGDAGTEMDSTAT